MSVNYEEIIPHLMISRTFQNLTREQLMDFAKLAKEITIDPNEFIVMEGQIAENTYFIKDGKVVVLKEDHANNCSMELATLYSGDTIGELSLIEHSPHSARSASIKTLTRTEVYVFNNDELYAEDKMPRTTFNAFVFNLAQLLCHRLRQSNERRIACIYEGNF